MGSLAGDCPLMFEIGQIGVFDLKTFKLIEIVAIWRIFFHSVLIEFHCHISQNGNMRSKTRKLQFILMRVSQRVFRLMIVITGVK